MEMRGNDRDKTGGLRTCARVGGVSNSSLISKQTGWKAHSQKYERACNEGKRLWVSRERHQSWCVGSWHVGSMIE